MHPQTGARYVPEGGRGVIPAARAVGPIPRLYFILPGFGLGSQALLRRCAELCRDRAIGEGLARGNNLSKGFAACDPRICHPGRAPDMQDDF